MPVSQEQDLRIRTAAFEHVRKLQMEIGLLPVALINQGFSFQGERIPLHNMQQGIFKPRQMRNLLSIKTVIPAQGKKHWYDDQLEAHSQIYQRSETIDYSFMGTDPQRRQNLHLRDAYEEQLPVIYFLGVAPALYEFIPVFISGWDEARLKASVTFGYQGSNDVNLNAPSGEAERRYTMQKVKQRLHQSTFRESVISAYSTQCAISRLREPQLLDAAHIVADKDELLGQPVVPNGLPLSKIHHAAFDNNLIGIDPDYRVHVSERLLAQRDGPMLESLKSTDGVRLHLPKRVADRPDRERLEIRFQEFQQSV